MTAPHTTTPLAELHAAYLSARERYEAAYSRFEPATREHGVRQSIAQRLATVEAEIELVKISTHLAAELHRLALAEGDADAIASDPHNLADDLIACLLKTAEHRRNGTRPATWGAFQARLEAANEAWHNTAKRREAADFPPPFRLPIVLECWMWGEDLNRRIFQIRSSLQNPWQVASKRIADLELAAAELRGGRYAYNPRWFPAVARGLRARRKAAA